MKKIFPIAILFFLQNIFCQEYQYHFDYLLEYKSNDTNQIINIFNSKDDTFKMRINRGNNNYYADIIDDKNKIIHYHEAINTTNNSIQFNYLFSKKFEANSSFKYNFFFDMTEKKIDSSKTEVNILVYRNKKKKKILKKIELIIDHSEPINNIDLLNLFTHHTFLDGNLQIIKGIPLSIKIDNVTENKKYNFDLLKKQRINTILTIDNIKIKQYN